MVPATDTRQRFSQSDLVAVNKDGPYRLTLRHVHGVIVEYFHTTPDALRRLVELEDLLGAAQGFDQCVTRSGPR